MNRVFSRIYSKIVVFVSAIVLSTDTNLHQSLIIEESPIVCDREYKSLISTALISTESKKCDILVTNENGMDTAEAKNSNLTKS